MPETLVNERFDRNHELETVAPTRDDAAAVAACSLTGVRRSRRVAGVVADVGTDEVVGDVLIRVVLIGMLATS
jgi:hypothetical protein